MDITEFLLARIAEDEAIARAAIDPHGSRSSPEGRWRFEDVAYQGEWPRNPQPYEDDDPELITWSESKWVLHANRHSPARVLRECVAKRELVDAWHDEHGGGHVLKTLAAVYSDHPDYQEKWSL